MRPMMLFVIAMLTACEGGLPAAPTPVVLSVPEAEVAPLQEMVAEVDTPAPASEPKEEPEPEPEPEPPAAPAECSDTARVDAILGCSEGGAHVFVTVSGEGEYSVFLMKRTEPFAHEIKAEGRFVVACGRTNSIELDHVDATPPTEYEEIFPPVYVVTVFDGGTQLVYHEVPECQ